MNVKNNKSFNQFIVIHKVLMPYSFLFNESGS